MLKSRDALYAIGTTKGLHFSGNHEKDLLRRPWLGQKRHPHRSHAAATEDQMITVKLYGLLRIESGIKEKQLEAAAVKEVLDQLVACGIDRKDLSGCVILVNGSSANKRSKLTDGDTVVLMSPVAGG